MLIRKQHEFDIRVSETADYPVHELAYRITIQRLDPQDRAQIWQIEADGVFRGPDAEQKAYAFIMQKLDR